MFTIFFFFCYCSKFISWLKSIHNIFKHFPFRHVKVYGKYTSWVPTRQCIVYVCVLFSSVKEVTNSAANPFVRSRPSHAKMNTLVVPPKKKEVMAELASNKISSNNFSTSPHRSQSGVNTGNSLLSGKPPPPPPPNANGRNNNPDLVRRPLRQVLGVYCILLMIFMTIISL